MPSPIYCVSSEQASSAERYSATAVAAVVTSATAVTSSWARPPHVLLRRLSGISLSAGGYCRTTRARHPPDG